MSKYAERKYVLRREETDPCRLYDTVRSRDLTSLLQLYAEGVDLTKPLVLPDGQVGVLDGREYLYTYLSPATLVVNVMY